MSRRPSGRPPQRGADRSPEGGGERPSKRPAGGARRSGKPTGGGRPSKKPSGGDARDGQRRSGPPRPPRTAGGEARRPSSRTPPPRGRPRAAGPSSSARRDDDGPPLPPPPSAPLPVVRLRTAPPRAETWIYRKMVAAPAGRVEPGALVRVEDREGRFVGQGFYNPRSEIELRLLSRSETPPLGAGWLRMAVRRAARLRREVLGLDAVTDAYRVVFSEADSLSGLIVDRYADVLSCQVLSLGIHRAFADIRIELEHLFSPRVIHVATDARAAKKEGFPLPDGAGAAARTVVQEYGLRFEVDPVEGHKTGFFLDQRDARQRVRELAPGRRVLDLCSYTGGFALNAAKGGATSVLAVDLDEDAIAQGRRNAALNGGPAHLDFRHADAFDVLREARPGQYDLIVVDPAKQALQRDQVDRALAFYRDLNQLAFEKVARGGLVLTCSCTGLVSLNQFLGALTGASERAARPVQFLEVAGNPADHPVSADFPQAAYLKRVLCHVG